MSVLPRIALFLQYVLPRNSRNTQNLLAVYSPTDCTDLHRTFLPYILPQIAQIFTDVAFRGCTCLNFTNPVVVASLGLLVNKRQVHPLKEPICVDLCNLWENTFSNLFREFREFCGRISRQSNLRG